MEEKERYKYYVETNQVYDSKEDELYAYNLNNNKIISILNQQDAIIKKLAITEKALELACGYISCLDVDGFKCNGEKNCIYCCNEYHREKHLSNYFKQQAKEILENE